jgi:hypothetical protein
MLQTVIIFSSYIFSILRGHIKANKALELVMFVLFPLEFSFNVCIYILSYNPINLLKKQRFVDVNQNFFVSVSWAF